jgi:hypothetical protein
MTYTGRLGSSAVIVDATGEIIGPEHVEQWAAYQAWVAAGHTPTPAPAATLDVPLAQLAFLGLFSAAQQSAIAVSADPAVARFRLMAALAPQIHLTDPRVAQGLDACVSAGLISAADKTRILAGSSPTA